ncbi:MAG: hypothetical protein CK527_07130 [Nitrosarchaeum sp.]|nr:MAG: hypothetical protein CK527_07130 [Nitrosarchaeum sp.]
MGYAEARELYKQRHYKVLKNSWIANVLGDHGKTSRKSITRKGNYKYPCPDDVRLKLEKILKELKMI